MVKSDQFSDRAIAKMAVLKSLKKSPGLSIDEPYHLSHYINWVSLSSAPKCYIKFIQILLSFHFFKGK